MRKQILLFFCAAFLFSCAGAGGQGDDEARAGNSVC